MMFREKAARLFRRLKRNGRPMLTVGIPAVAAAVVLAALPLSVMYSDDASFKPCGRMLTQCAREEASLGEIAVCAYKTAWCDAGVLWDRMNGKKFPDLEGLPPVDEKADKELFEKLTSDDFLEKRFKELEAEQSGAVDAMSDDDLKEYMERARRDRIAFEKELAEKRAAAALPAVDDDLSGKRAQ